MKQINSIWAILIIILCTLSTEAIPSSTRARKAISEHSSSVQEAFAEKNLTLGSAIYMRLFKEEDVLELWVKEDSSFVLFKEYPICSWGGGTLGPKIMQGDGQAPEGFYFITPNQLNPYSSFHLSMNVGYPNRYDRVHSRTGSALMIHGACASIGCYAMTDLAIEEIYTIVHKTFEAGQKFFRVHIFPFKMTSERLDKEKDNEWYSFWKNLQEGYNAFETYGNNPPNVVVVKKAYKFQKP